MPNQGYFSQAISPALHISSRKESSLPVAAYSACLRITSAPLPTSSAVATAIPTALATSGKRERGHQAAAIARITSTPAAIAARLQVGASDANTSAVKASQPQRRAPGQLGQPANSQLTQTPSMIVM